MRLGRRRLLADEPTGNLDTENANTVLDVLRDLNQHLGQTILMITHNQGATVTVTDPSGHWKTSTSDGFGNVIQVNEPNPAGGADFVATYSYNNFNKLTTVVMTRKSPGNVDVTQTRTFHYDSTQQLDWLTQPETGTAHTSYTYDTAGNVRTKTDPGGNVITYSYDAYNRLSNITRAPGTGFVEPSPTTDFAYDTTTTQNPNGTYLQGRLSQITHASGITETFSYSVAGHTVKKGMQTANGNITGNFTYDNEGRLTQTQLPTPANSPTGTRQWTYDDYGRQIALTLPIGGGSAPFIQGATYNVAGQLSTYQRTWLGADNGSGNWGVNPPIETVTLTYNVNGQMTGQSGNGPGPVITYGYSASQNDGRLQSMTDQSKTYSYNYDPAYYLIYKNPQSYSAGYTGQAVNYGYDSLGRLTTAGTGTTWGQAFVYDGFGNLYQQNVTAGSAPAMNLTIDDTSNRITTSGFTFDANGNQTASPLGTFHFDSENRLSSATVSGQTANYLYGASNERLKDEKHYYFYGPGGQRLGKRTITTSVWSEDLYFAGRLVWQDGQGIQTDRTGHVIQRGIDRIAYFPYGVAITGEPPNPDPSSTMNSPTRFGTYGRDSLSGLDYAMNRYYADTAGRFMTADPYGGSGKAGTPSSWNRYSYVKGDPVNKTDRSGFCADDGSSDDDSDKPDNSDQPEGSPEEGGDATPGGGSGSGVYPDPPEDDQGMDGDSFRRAPGAPNWRVMRKMGNKDCGGTSQPLPPCPAGQARMDNGKCDVPLTSNARQVLGQTGQITAPMASGCTYAAWTAAAAVVGGGVLLVANASVVYTTAINNYAALYGSLMTSLYSHGPSPDGPELSSGLIATWKSACSQP